jgi:hypothetical protein
MRDDPRRNIKSSDSPFPRHGFEAELIGEVTRLVADLPTDSARLKISRVPGHPEWPEPYFEVTPTNSKAAPFSGVVVGTDLNLTIGRAAWREFVGFARGGTVARGSSWQEEFRWIWQAVIRGGFTEHLYLDSEGKTIGWATKLSVNGKDLIIRNGRRTNRLFSREKPERITYESYI